MLQRLRISNYAIIEQVDIRFSNDLNIITGETGAGKSILMGAVSLILGKRADTKVLYNTEKKCIAEAIFTLERADYEEFFRENDLDFESETIIRREITPSGKSRAFINDTPVNLNTLRDLTSTLVDLNAQHETLEIGRREFVYLLLDSTANQLENNNYKDSYKSWKQHQKELEALKQNASTAAQESDYLSFQLKELDEAGLDDINSLEALEKEQMQLANAEKIRQGLGAAMELLENGEINAIDLLNSAATQLSDISSYDDRLETLAERLNSASIELGDIRRELGYLEENTEIDEESLQTVNDQLDEVYRLLKKHGQSTLEELINYREMIREKLSIYTNTDAHIAKMEVEIAKEETGLKAMAAIISEGRQEVAPEIEKAVMQKLQEMGMPHAEFKIDIQQGELNTQGFDIIKLLFSANKGARLEEVKQVASGGELSRLMLSLKSMIAANAELPTLIFDEIDTGVSGEVALKVGGILKELGQKHQVISITHLPQIAGKGAAHFFVYKTADNGKTTTHVKELQADERKIEIAKMLSGENYTEAALQNAEELLN